MKLGSQESLRRTKKKLWINLNMNSILKDRILICQFRWMKQQNGPKCSLFFKLQTKQLIQQGWLEIYQVAINFKLTLNMKMAQFNHQMLKCLRIVLTRVDQRKMANRKRLKRLKPCFNAAIPQSKVWIRSYLIGRSKLELLKSTTRRPGKTIEVKELC